MQNVTTTTGSLSNAKIMGGIGSILTLLLFIPNFVGAVLVIIGWVLIILAIRDISNASNERAMFSNAMVSAILAIVATIVFAVVVAAAVLGFIGLGGSLSSSTTTPPTINSGFAELIAGVLAGLAVVWVIGMVGSYFLWKSFKMVSARVNVGLFGTSALIYFIGSILTVILIGFALTFIAQILFIIAFFSLPDRIPPQMATPSFQPPSTTMGPP